MNTKIYNGFKLDGINTLDGVYDYVNSLTEEFSNVADEIWIKIAVNDAVLAYDYNAFMNLEHSESYLSDANESIESDLLMACRRGVMSQLDLEVRLCFRLIDNKDENYIIGLHFIPNEELRKLFSYSDKIKDYSFYDGEDKPSNVTKKEWNRRKLDWNHVFNDSDNPDVAMFTINVLKTGPRNIAINDVNNYIPEKSNRAENLANKLLIDKLLAKDNTENTFETHDDVFEYLNGAEHANNVIAESKKLISSLNDVSSDSLI